MSFKTTVYGKYFLLDRIAVGGMAEVFKAKTFGVRGFERLLVIKRILPHLSKDDEFVEMFIDEAKISVGLTHANICQVTDLGKIGDNYFIAMEYIDGKDLRAILKKCHQKELRLGIPQALFVGIEMLKGLEYAHTKSDPMAGKPLNVIHRDISPQNIMISYNGEVKIVDFGIAKTEFKLNRTQAGVLKGKFGYMSPEQAAGLEVDSRTDVFSAGIILYEMLTGRRLFLGETDFDTLEKIKECVVPPPSKYNPAIRPDLQQVMLKALAKEREDRYPTAQAFQGALARIFYTQHPDFSSRDLSQFLRTLFSEDIEHEQEALRRAIDSLPAEEVAAATSAAEGANDRLIDSGSERPSFGSSGSRPSRARRVPIGAFSFEPKKTSPRWLSAAAKISAAIGGILVGVLLGWKWLHQTPIPAVVATPAPVAKTPALTTIQITTDPPGAKITINEKPKGQTPASLDLAVKTWIVVRFEKDGFKPLSEQVFVTEDQSTYGPYKLQRDVPAVGALQVTSDPSNAVISFDGEKTSFRTPAIIENVSLNVEHRISLELNGFRKAVKKFVPTEPEDKLHFKLEQNTVVLKINARPSDARVLIDGKERGQVIEDLETGKTYGLRVEAPGYYPMKRDITLSRPREEMDVELKKVRETETGTLSLNANPWANVIIDGKTVGVSPVLDYELSAGQHTIIFRHPDFKPVQKTITIKKGKNPDLIIDFRS